MFKGAIVIPTFLVLVLGGCGGGNGERVYKNADFGFSVLYPSDYSARELKWVKEPTGVVLQKKEGTITVQAMAAGTMYEDTPFDDYARIAAAAEIQNFDKLISIERFTSEYGIRGYKTYWKVIQHEDTDTGEINAATKVGPIYYFPPRLKQKLGDQPVKTIMISGDPAVQKDAESIATSFRYLNSFKALFRKGHHGKIFFVEKGKPFKIELEANPTTGYNWHITEIDENYFKVRSSGYQAEATGRIGSGGKSYWNIIPLKEGISTIRLLYYRVWEGKDKAVDKFTVRIVIK